MIVVAVSGIAKGQPNPIACGGHATISITRWNTLQTSGNAQFLSTAKELVKQHSSQKNKQ